MPRTGLSTWEAFMCACTLSWSVCFFISLADRCVLSSEQFLSQDYLMSQFLGSRHVQLLKYFLSILSCSKDEMNFKRYHFLETTLVSFNTIAQENTPCHFRQTSNFLFISPPVSQLLCRMKCFQIAETVISTTVSSISFLACPFSFMKVTDILPGCLSNCVSTLEPATHPLPGIFYAEFSFPSCLAPQKTTAATMSGRETSLMAVSFALNHIHSCQSLLFTGWTQNICCVNKLDHLCLVMRLLRISLSSVPTEDGRFHFINI